MTTDLDCAKFSGSKNPKVSKNVQESAQVSPPGSATMLAEMLRQMEEHLLTRGLLKKDPCSQFNPIWYLAETERNIFLWKKGCSIIQQDEFEFWVDIPQLINKRLDQLNNLDQSNPLVNPYWGLSAISEQDLEDERNYLNNFLTLITSVQNHIAAFCEASLIALGQQLQRERIILPVMRNS